MRFAAFVFAFALTAALPAFAGDAAPVNIQASEAAQHVGQKVTVIGMLTNVHVTRSGKAVIWDIGGKFPDNPFSAYLSTYGRGTVPDLTPMVGKIIAVTGVIKLYHDKPEIEVTDAKQVAVAR